MKDTLALVEKFYSVQGEGANVGRAAFFVRFAGCNLDCVFADGSVCDTPWRKAQEKISIPELIDWMSATETDAFTNALQREDVLDYDHTEGAIVILTGGEPTMAPAFDRLVDELKFFEYYVAVESNGTKWRDSLKQVDWLVVSPKNKISHAVPLDSPAVHPDVVPYVREFRWVISDRNTPRPEIPREARKDARLFVSPAFLADGTGVEWKEESYVPTFAPGAVERCMEIVQSDPSFRLSIQTHKFLRVR